MVCLMTNRGAEVNRQAAQRRADSYWLVYQALGRDRSLSKLHQTLTDLGLHVALGTLKAYSVRYNWQQCAELVDGAHTSIELANVPREMDERQARLGVAMQVLAREKMEVIDAYCLFGA
jgi:uncharacterized membrane protein YebE (DUF533 family)